MGKTNYVKKSRISLFAIILAVVAVAALAAGIYFLVTGENNKEPNRGTYVINQAERSRRFEKTN